MSFKNEIVWFFSKVKKARASIKRSILTSHVLREEKVHCPSLCHQEPQNQEEAI